MVSVPDLTTKEAPTWCPGCGNFGILAAEKMAISELGLDPKKVIEVSGIGCASLFPHWIKVNACETLHGRTLPVASGIKFANRNLNVLVHAGDGDAYGIGMGHFIHTMRRNVDLTFIVHDNQVYALTKGQYSPTTPKGRVSSTTPHGAIEIPVNPIALALNSNCTFVARGFAGDIPHLKELIKQGIQHKGFSLISVFQPCVSYNKINTAEWWREHIYKLEETGYKPDNKIEALKKANEWGDKIPIGVFYKEEKPTYEDQVPVIKEKELVDQDISNVDISKILEKYY